MRQPLFYLCRMNKRYRAHAALLGTTLIFGMHYSIAKSMMPGVFTPEQLIFLRLLAGAVLFWFFERLFVREKTERRDILKFALCGVLGFSLNQALFYEGLNLTNPVDASIIHLVNPIIVLIFAHLIIREEITTAKTLGILLGATGALVLILYSGTISFRGQYALGNLLVLLNTVFYALYLVLIKPLTAKYHTATILKWVSIFGFLFILPFTFRQALDIRFNTLTPTGWAGLAYIILLNTFVAYLLINFALQQLTPGVIGYYSYLQPVIATLLTVSAGQGTITLPKIVAALLIFAGIWIINRRKAIKG